MRKNESSRLLESPLLAKFPLSLHFRFPVQLEAEMENVGHKKSQVSPAFV
jgi:hypothetical protein